MAATTKQHAYSFQISMLVLHLCWYKILFTPVELFL